MNIRLFRIYYFIITGLILFSYACIANDTITIKKYFGDIKVEKEELPANIEKYKIETGLFETITKIEGVEELKNLKYLYIGYGLEDYSFLEKLENIEILALELSPSTIPINLDFIKKFKKLKTAYFNAVIMETPILDLVENNKLEYLFLGNIRSEKHEKYFKFDIKNVPSSMKCIDLHLSAFIIISETFLEEIIHVPLILLHKESKSFGNIYKVSKEYIDTHTNIHIDNINEIIPNELDRDFIYNFFDKE
ncbi:MAG: hypothetical protein JXC36_09680 [Candidatus Atribacteria bacterium]|nr:hypothetical protein [Candidatus Atribacteria bacterium]